MIRLMARIAGAIIVVCIVVLMADWAVATRRAPREDKLLKSLQEQVKTDAALAPKLAAEQKRITDSRRARKSRDRAVAYVVIAWAIVFLICAKRLVERRAPVRLEKLVHIQQPKRPNVEVAAVPDATDLSFVDELVARVGRGREAAIPLLQAIQAHYRYLPDAALRRVCDITEITPAQIAGTSSFYGQFRRSPVGRHIVRVCHGTACHVAGARPVTDELRRHLGIASGADTDPERLFTIEEVACLGCCSLAPVLMVDGQTAGRLTVSSAPAVLDAVEPREAV